MFNTSLWLLELQISLYPHVMFIQSDCFFWFQDIFWKLDWTSRCGIKTESICEHCSLWLSSFPVAGTVPQLYSARREGGGTVGVLTYINHTDMRRPKGSGIWAFLVWKRVYTCPFWSGIGYDFELREHNYEIFIVSIPNE